MQQQLDDVRLVLRQIYRWLWVAMFFSPIIYLISGFYSVGLDQRAYVSRFGKLVQDNVSSGMHYHLPWPIESVTIYNASALKSKVIEFSVTKPKEDVVELITANIDLVDIQVEVQYSVSETMKFVSATHDAGKILEQLAKSEVIFHISHNNFETLLTTGRNQLQSTIKNGLQKSGDHFHLGVRITGVQIKLLDPPQSIKQAFDDVSSAQSEKQKLIQEAKGERGAKLAKIRSDTNRQLSRARSRSNELVQQAEGDLHRFQSGLDSIERSGHLFFTKKYFEYLDTILNQADVIVISPDKH